MKKPFKDWRITKTVLDVAEMVPWIHSPVKALKNKWYVSSAPDTYRWTRGQWFKFIAVWLTTIITWYMTVKEDGKLDSNEIKQGIEIVTDILKELPQDSL